jgi:hypothetical protein
MDKRERDLRRLAKGFGLVVEKTRGGHLGLRDEKGALVAVTASTGSDRRGAKNLVAQLRRRERA